MNPRATPQPPPIRLVGIDGTVVPDRWAQGCGRCTFGLVHPPDIGHRPLYSARRIQFERGELQLCECRAGAAYAILLLKYSEQEAQR